MKEERKPGKEALAARWGTRAIKRWITLILWAFLFFLVVVLVVWSVPRIWALFFG